MIPSQVSSPSSSLRDTPSAVTSFTPIPSVTFTVTVITSLIFGLVGFSVTE